MGKCENEEVKRKMLRLYGLIRVIRIIRVIRVLSSFVLIRVLSSFVLIRLIRVIRGLSSIRGYSKIF
jgi:hypothetical protein